MKLVVLIIVLFLKTFWVSAQTQGIVKDSLTGKPISYVNIWVENENIATTSEEDGTFFITVSGNKNLIFSALGYEKKTIKASQSAEVFFEC